MIQHMPCISLMISHVPLLRFLELGRLLFRQHYLASMLGLLESDWAGLLSQKNSFLMASLLPRTSTVLFVLALMVHPMLSKLVIWLAFHKKAVMQCKRWLNSTKKMQIS